MRHSRRKRFSALTAVLGLLSTAAVLTSTQAPAGADTTQTMACFSPLTSTYATFPIPFGGTGAPDPILAGGSTSFTNLSTGLAIDPSLVIAGIGAGVLDFVTAPALIGTADPLSGGGDGVNAAANSTTARVNTTNTTGTSTFTLTGAVNATFFVVWDGADPATLVIYAETSPGSWTGSGTGGLVAVPSVPVAIPLAPDVVVTSNSGGDISLLPNLGPLPANPAAAPTTTERNNAPLVLLNNLGVQANFYCWPGQSNGAVDPLTGLPASSPGFTPAASASAIDTVTVNIPPTPPTAVDDVGSVGAGQAVTIDVAANDTDPNGDLDPTSVAVVTAPTGGTAVANGDGTITYTNTNTALTSDTFTYTVDDLAGATSNAATVTVGVLGDLCTAPCSLNQIIVTQVNGATMTLQQAGLGSPYGDFVVPMVSASSIAGLDGIPGTADDTPLAAAPITLNGQPQLAVGNLYQLTVTNARGTDAPWSLTGQVSAFSDGTVLPTCTATPATWNNHCIPGDNLGWMPSAAVAHTQVLGDVAAVTPGSSLYPPGFLLSGGPLAPTGLGSSAQVLCSAASGTSGGTFTCGGGLGLSVPASAAAGTYVGVLTLTLA